MYVHIGHYRGSPEESKGEEPSPVLMLRNLKEEVRKEDVSGDTLIFYNIRHFTCNLPLICRYLELLEWTCLL